MSNELTMQRELSAVLKSSLYPGAADESISLVLNYCKAANLDPMQKPVHIVPMFDKKTKSMRDVIMPGIGLYRIQASRTGQYAGVSDPQFGEDITEKVGNKSTTYPKWCKVTVRRIMNNGSIAEFSAVEFWLENYATAGREDASPNAMWHKRPYGQLAKCAEAQALRKAFPEIGSQPIAEEMEGKRVDDELPNGKVIEATHPVSLPTMEGESWAKAVANCAKGFRQGKSLSDAVGFYSARHALSVEQIAEIEQLYAKNAPIEAAATTKAEEPQGMSFAQVADAIHKAQDADALDMARGFIQAVPDAGMQAELHQKAAQKLAQIQQTS